LNITPLYLGGRFLWTQCISNSFWSA